MIVIVIGSGAREHAICRLINKSEFSEKLTCIPGNYGISKIAKCINLDNSEDILAYCLQNKPDLVIIGPEKYLAEGMADELRNHNILVFGPGRQGAQLESSKDYMKNFCKKYDIPTAYSETFTNLDESIEFVRSRPGKIVVKYDGLAAGKGVFVCENTIEAEEACKKIFIEKIFSDNNTIIIEDFIEGKELSYFVLIDDNSYQTFGSAQDYKRIGDSDTGPNTGGMGTISPAPILDTSLEKKIIDNIVLRSVEGIQKELIEFKGVLFLGIMVDEVTKEPKLLEYNTRFGDPEIQSISMRLTSDFLSLVHSVATNNLAYSDIKFNEFEKSICLILATQGYPENYPKNTIINNLDSFNGSEDFFIFHAATYQDEELVKTNGGRVLSIVASGDDYETCRKKVYEVANKIDWKEKYFRSDIGLLF